MKKVALLFVSAILASVLWPAPTLAQAVIPDMGADPLGFARLAYDAIHSRQWGLLVALALIALVWTCRRFAKSVAAWSPQSWFGRAAAWLTTDRGGVLLVVLGGLGSSVALAMLAGATLSTQMVLDGVMAAVTAAGGYAALRKLLFPSGVEQAQQVEAVATATEANASNGADAATKAINKALGRE